ncbi:hypothetical protein E1B28_003505 [Marasmius oreades]|uniref:Uncharacterized protein n=1 Tax=Marasmius oreades TaxID=181124 RepID=A0A9P7UMJ6_9AGAR|nr:uncharacterized protein E1B28_003505 [Marasmius oreades]KAG7085981.1 hypothetical protein E1B28_003505 [Marasmius oreades]
MLKTWLSRSIPLPISCHIDLNDPGERGDEPEHSIIALLIRDSHRWLDITFRLGRRPDLYYNIATIQSPLPLLRFFEISANLGSASNRLTSYENSTFASAPNLAEVLIDVNVDARSPLRFPWHQLRLYHCSNMNLFLETAVDLQNLTHLILFQSFHDFSTASPQQVSLARLRRLEIDLQYTAPVADLLDIMFLPSLQELKVESSGLSAESILSSIGHLQQRSSCRLKQLFVSVEIISMLLSRPELGKSLDAVEELHIRFDPLTPDAGLKFLHDRSAFPRLKALYLVVHLLHTYVHPDDNPCFDEIADVVTARRIPNQWDVQLERVSLDTATMYNSEFYGWRKPRIPASVRGIRRVTELQSQGLVLLESIVDGTLCPVLKIAKLWDRQRVDRDAARYLL